MVTTQRKHSENYYFTRREKIYDELSRLPRGTVKERLISGRKYYYFQRREGKKVVHTYIGKEIPSDLKQQLQKRQELRAELEKVREALLGFVSARIKNIL